MTFSLTMQCDNAAFEDDPDKEIARILRTVAGRFDDPHVWQRKDTEGLCLDYNGNTVGTWRCVP